MSLDPQGDQSLRGLFRRIGRRRRLLLVVATLVFTGVALWTFLVTPRYRSQAVVRIAESKTGMPSMPDALKDLPGLELAGLGKDELDTEIGVLKSARMSDAAIDGLALAVRVKPAHDRASVIRARVVNDSDVDGKVTFVRQDDGQYRVDTDELEEYPGLPAVLSPGDSMRVGSIVLGLPEHLKRSGPAEIKVKLLPRYEVYKLLEKRLAIRQQEGGSRLVEVVFDDPDRHLAAQVVERIVREYVNYSLQADLLDEGKQTSELREALAGSALRLRTSEDRQRDFQTREKLVVPQEQAEAQVKRIGLLDVGADAARIERNALARVLDVVGKRSRGGGDPNAFRQLASFPSLISNGAVQDLLQGLLELETQRSALTVTRTDANAEVKQLTARITDIEQQLFRLGSQYLESLDQQIAATSRTVNSLTDTLVALPATAMRYAQLLRDSKIANEEFLQLTKQLKMAELQDVLRKDKVRVVDIPRVANEDDPEFPRKKVQLTLGAILALVLAFAAGLIAELWSESAD